MSIDLQEMLKAGVHFGHKTSRWSPKMHPFIWGAKNKVHLIDVSKSAFLLERAGNFLKDLSGSGKSFLFVGTKKAAQATTQKVAVALGMPFVINRWVGGTLSNYDQVKKAITRYLHLQDVVKKSTAHYKKKEIVMMNKEIARLEKNIGGIVNLDYPPAAIIIVDAKKEHSTVKEASKLGIPVVAMVDTNTDPDGVSFVIPSNDDSPKAIAFILNYLETVIKDGRKIYLDQKAKEKAEVETKRASEKAARDKVEKEKADERAAKAAEAKAATAATVKTEVKKAAPVVKPKVESAPATEKVAEKQAPKEVKAAEKAPKTSKEK